MNDEAVEVIMNLRSQVALQRQIHELETLVETYQSERLSPDTLPAGVPGCGLG